MQMKFDFKSVIKTPRLSLCEGIIDRYVGKARGSLKGRLLESIA